MRLISLLSDLVNITNVGAYIAEGEERDRKTPSPKLGTNTGNPRIFFSVFIL